MLVLRVFQSMEKYLRDASCFSIIHDGQGLLNLDDQVGIF